VSFILAWRSWGLFCSASELICVTLAARTQCGGATPPGSRHAIDVDQRLPNDSQKDPNWCCRFPDMCACNCSGDKSDAGARLAIAVLESVGRILPKLLLSLARSWIENRPNDREYQREIVSVADARRMVAHARAQGWLTPESKTADNRDLAHE